MSDFGRPSAITNGREKRRTPGSRFGDLGDRLARTFGGYDRPDPDVKTLTATRELDYPDERAPLWDQDEPRFPVMPEGYDPTAVDEYVDDLERELAELRTQTSPAPSVSAEIERIGKQTAVILQTAHEQAGETVRRAQHEAESCLADAASNAVAMTDDAKRKLRELDAETETIWRERTRLLDDTRDVATSLLALADAATARFAAEPQKSGPDASVPPAAASGSTVSSTPSGAMPAPVRPFGPEIAESPSQPVPEADGHEDRPEPLIG